LDSKLFFRPHDSYIINLNKVAKYNKGEGGTIELFDGTTIDVSRRKKQEFLKIFEG
jgi:two-component system, LytTR family, response regulator